MTSPVSDLGRGDQVTPVTARESPIDLGHRVMRLPTRVWSVAPAARSSHRGQRLGQTISVEQVAGKEAAH